MSTERFKNVTSFVIQQIDNKTRNIFKSFCRHFFTSLFRDRAAFLRLGGLNEMPKAFLARAVGASVLGGSGGMLPRKFFKLNASRMAKNTSQYSRHSEFFYYLSG